MTYDEWKLATPDTDRNEDDMIITDCCGSLEYPENILKVNAKWVDEPSGDECEEKQTWCCHCCKHKKGFEITIL